MGFIAATLAVPSIAICELSPKCVEGLKAHKPCSQTTYSGHHACYQGLKVWQKLLTQKWQCPQFDDKGLGAASAFCWCGVGTATSELRPAFNATSEHDESEKNRIFARLEKGGTDAKVDGALVRKGRAGPCLCYNQHDGDMLKRRGKNG